MSYYSYLSNFQIVQVGVGNYAWNALKEPAVGVFTSFYELERIWIYVLRTSLYAFVFFQLFETLYTRSYCVRKQCKKKSYFCHTTTTLKLLFAFLYFKENRVMRVLSFKNHNLSWKMQLFLLPIKVAGFQDFLVTFMTILRLGYYTESLDV